MKEPPTGELYAGEPPVQFGGREGGSLPDPYHKGLTYAAVEFKSSRLNVTFPPLQGEGEGGDGLASVRARHTHPPPNLPLEGGGAKPFAAFRRLTVWWRL